MPKKDFSQIAFESLQKAVGAHGPATTPIPVPKGRSGGLKGGAARASVLTKKQRSEIAKIAAAARWKKG